MRLIRNPVTLSLLAILGVSLALAVFVAERYHYYDFEEAQCSNLSSALRISLVGTFDPGRPSERGNPYYLRVEVLPMPNARANHAILSRIKLASVQSGKEVRLGAIKRSEVVNSSSVAPVVVYVASKVELPYEDYQVNGVMDMDQNGNRKSVSVACILKTKYWREWRVPFWDTLMSV
jgi:hypothetical protein